MAMADNHADSPAPHGKMLSAARIAEIAGGKIISAGGGHLKAARIATPDSAAPGVLCFAASKAAASAIPDDAQGFICLVHPDYADGIPAGSDGAIITCAAPKTALAHAMAEMFGDSVSARHVAGANSTGDIHASAIIADDATIGKNVSIGAHAVIESGAVIGDGSIIAAGAVIGAGCSLGRSVSIGANSVISHCAIGDDSHIGALSKIGGAGFGIGGGDNNSNHCLPHAGRVILGQGCYLSGQCSIDRGFIEDTILGDRVMIDNCVHIAHNCHIGDDTVICGQSGFAGSCRIGAGNLFGAMCGVADNVAIGAGNMFAAKTGITADVGDNMVMGGFPAVPIAEFRRQAVALRRLGKDKKQGDAK